LSLRARLSLVFALVVLAPMLAGALLVATLVPRALDNQADARLIATRALAVSAVDGLCTRARLAAELVGREALQVSPAAAVADIVRRGLASYAVFAAPSGAIRAAGSLPGEGRPAAASLGDCENSAAYRAGSVIGSTVVLRSPAGRQVGLAGAAFPAASAIDAILRGADVGVTLAVGRRPVASTLPAAVARVVAAHPAQGSRPETVGGLLVLTAPLTAVGVTASVSAAAPSEGGLDLALAGLLVAGLGLAGVVGWMLARATVRPLEDLADAADRVASGDLDTRISVRGHGEVARLATAFNEMTRELRISIGEIRSSHSALRRTLDQFGETLSGTLDINRILVAVLDAAMTMTGAAAGAVYLSADGGLARLAARRGPSTFPLPGEVQPPVGETMRRDRIVAEIRGGRGATAVLLVAADPRSAAGFDEEHRDSVRTLAAHAAVAVANVRLHEEAQRLSTTDELTGLANFRAFQAVLAKEVERAARFGRPLGLLMADLDMFKSVNDSYGHQRGDEVLAEVARRISSCVREVDTVARYGGEEFAVVLPEADAAGAARTAERICRAVRAHPVQGAGEAPVAVTVSVGAAVYPVHGPDAAALVRTADRAMYAAKRAGRDRWRLEPISRIAPETAGR
jgi:two-component system cell cycle response regulator